MVTILGYELVVDFDLYLAIVNVISGAVCAD